MNKTYTFRGMSTDGSVKQVQVSATSFQDAVQAFAHMDKPATMGWTVSNGTTTHPVTRARWGHSYDGRKS